jgi:hypothetical protein
MPASESAIPHGRASKQDLRHIMALFYNHEVWESSDVNAISAGYVAGLCAADWGYGRTCELNTERVQEGLQHCDISAAEKETLRDRIRDLWARIEAEPEPRKWKMRNRIGDKVRWYEEPEEVG